MNKEIQQRLGWIKLFEDTNDAGLVCRRCGISRPTLRKWWKRYSEQGIEGFGVWQAKVSVRLNHLIPKLINTLKIYYYKCGLVEISELDVCKRN